jgi:uncharacterized protein (TIGR02246 family)
MNPRTPRVGSTETNDEAQVRRIYKELLDRWNKRDASGMSELFAKDGNIIGFDGSQINGRQEAENVMGKIFSIHQTASFIGIIREIRFLSPEIAILRAVAGMVPQGQSDIDPSLNAVQTLVAAEQQGQWYIALFQNTPAAFHGRLDLSEQLTAELRKALHDTAGK